MYIPTVGIAIKNILPSIQSGAAWLSFLCQVEALRQEGFSLSLTPQRSLSVEHVKELLHFATICEVVYPLTIARDGLADPREKMLAWIRRTLSQGPVAHATQRAKLMADMVPDAVHVGVSHIEEPTIYSHVPEGVVQYLVGAEDPARKITLDSYHLGRMIDRELLVATLPLFVEKRAAHIASVHLHLRNTEERAGFMTGRNEYARKYLRAVQNEDGRSYPVVVELGSQKVAPTVALELLRQIRQVMLE